MKQRSFLEKVRTDDRFHFLCEIKRASPTAGIINQQVDPVKQALAYQAGGATGLSVLTDHKFFKGSIEDLQIVRQAVTLPVLRKDFIIDAYQIYESAAMGADLILLIVRILSKKQIDVFLSLAAELGLEILIELYDASEVNRLPQNLHHFPVLLGINNRNLATFEVDLMHSVEMLAHLPADVPVISESGIKNVEDCLTLKAHGFRGVLIGETLMRQARPVLFLEELVKATNHVHTS